MRELLATAASEVLYHPVVLQHAREYFEERDASREWIANGLEHEERKRLGVADLPHSRLGVTFGSSLHRAAFCRGWQVVNDEVEHFVGAHIAQAGSEQHRENLVFANGVVQASNDVFFADGAGLEELLH